ncbi:MAG: hypothetical protein QME74_04705, partial [Candidatus Edwardsbacteria bacterium]|nr:hypothetical protein [Candidatus Edwardsbacteria bacterium]
MMSAINYRALDISNDAEVSTVAKIHENAPIYWTPGYSPKPEQIQRRIQQLKIMYLQMLEGNGCCCVRYLKRTTYAIVLFIISMLCFMSCSLSFKPGTIVRLNNGALSANSVELHNEMMKYIRANDEIGLKSMVISGAVLSLDNNTKGLC